MQKEEYQVGDIIKLTDEGLSKIGARHIFKQNLFVISQINEESVCLRCYDGEFKITDVKPVAVNGIEDRNVYYDPIVIAQVVRSGEVLKASYTDVDQYYLDALKNSYMLEGISYHDVICEKKYAYVHEIQHEFSELRLRVNYTL